MNIDATFWVAVSFLIFIIGLIYLKVPQLVNKTINTKIAETKNELDEAEKLKDEAKNLLSDYENKLNQANKETTEIVKIAKQESEKNLIYTNEKFYQLIDNKKKMLNSKIKQIKEDSIKEIRNTSIKIAIRAVEKVVRDSIDKKKLDRLYDESLNQTKIALKKTIT